MSNVNKCLDALKESDVEFVNIHAENIIEGDEKITLGLIWTILHHFQVLKNFDYLILPFLILKSIPLKSKNAGRFEKLLGFVRSHSFVTRG